MFKKYEVHQIVLPINFLFQLYQIKVQYDMSYNIILPLFLLFSQRLLRIISLFQPPIQNANNNFNINNNNNNNMGFKKKLKTLISILFYFDKIYQDYLYDNGTANAYLLGMVYYQTYYNLLFSLRMIQGNLSADINDEANVKCNNIWLFHSSYLNTSAQAGCFENQSQERSYQFIVFAVLNGLLIFTGLHIATKIGCTMKSEWMYLVLVRVLESVKYFTITFFKVYLMNNNPIKYAITQVIKIISIVNLPLQYVPIQQNDFIMSSIFQVNLYPATLSYCVQGMRVIQEQNMRDTWFFLIIEQIDNLSTIVFYLVLILKYRYESFLSYEWYFLVVSITAQIINLATILHTYYLLQKYGPILKLKINKPDPSYDEVNQLLTTSPRIITQQIEIKITQEPSDSCIKENFIIKEEIVKMMFKYSNLYDITITYTDQNKNTIIFEIFANIRKFHVSMNNYQLFEDNFSSFEKIYWFVSKKNYILEFNRYNLQTIKKQDEFRIFKFKLYIIKITFPKFDISISVKKNMFNRQEFQTTLLLEKYVANCHSVLAYLKNLESEMDFNPKQILYDLYDFN